MLMTLWAQPNIQKQLLTTAANSQVFTYLSNELALVGFNKTPLQCSVKVNNLKGEYRRVKELKLQSEVKSDWFAILDSVLGLDGEVSTGVGSSAALTQSETPEDEHENGMLFKTARQKVHLQVKRAVTVLIRFRCFQQTRCRLFGHQMKSKCC